MSTVKVYPVVVLTEHEGPVSAVDISSDGMRILAGTSVVSGTHSMVLLADELL